MSDTRRYFKVILDETPPRKMIAFLAANADTKARPRELVTTVDAVEKATGLDFFSKLKPAEQSALESKSNFDDWER